jgi:serine/threonine protein phosphatase 1
MTGRILAIGDIHGCNHQLENLLEKIAFEPRADTLVLVGDYIDRGPDSRGVIDTLLELKESCPGMVCLKGNHEEMLLNYYLDGRGEQQFFINGGLITLDSYGLNPADARAGRGLPESHLDFLRSLRLFHETEDYLFVHAGLRPGIPLAEQSPSDLLWIRYEFIDSAANFGRTVVFGHTPLHGPLSEPNKIGIDTGAVYGGHLTCVELPSRKFHQA